MSKEEDYLRQNVKQVLQPLIRELLNERPEEPVIKYNILFYRFYICFNGFTIIMI